MKRESIEMPTPGQAPESAPTRGEWITWCKTTCFSQKARGNFELVFRLCSKNRMMALNKGDNSVLDFF